MPADKCVLHSPKSITAVKDERPGSLLPRPWHTETTALMQCTPREAVDTLLPSWLLLTPS